MQLRDFRISIGQSQRRAAREIGVDQSSIVRYENGRVIPRGRIMRLIMEWSGDKVRPGDFYSLPTVAAGLPTPDGDTLDNREI